MAIRSITRGEFELLMPSHGLLRSVLGQQVDWYVNETEDVIGTVATSKAEKTWVYVLLGRERTGAFRTVAMNRTMETREEAENRLVHAMVAAEQGRLKLLARHN